jgi:hypothetical protein
VHRAAFRKKRGMAPVPVVVPPAYNDDIPVQNPTTKAPDESNAVEGIGSIGRAKASFEFSTNDEMVEYMQSLQLAKQRKGIVTFTKN